MSQRTTKLRKGNTVVMTGCGEANHYPGVIWICAADEFTNKAKQRVVMLENYSGSFMVNCLRPVNLKADDIVVCTQCDTHMVKQSDGYTTDGADIYCIRCEEENNEKAIAERNVQNALRELTIEQPLYLVINTKRNPVMTEEIINVLKKYDCWGPNY